MKKAIISLLLLVALILLGCSAFSDIAHQDESLTEVEKNTLRFYTKVFSEDDIAVVRQEFGRALEAYTEQQDVQQGALPLVDRYVLLFMKNTFRSRMVQFPQDVSATCTTTLPTLAQGNCEFAIEVTYTIGRSPSSSLLCLGDGFEYMEANGNPEYLFHPALVKNKLGADYVSTFEECESSAKAAIAELGQQTGEENRLASGISILLSAVFEDECDKAYPYFTSAWLDTSPEILGGAIKRQDPALYMTGLEGNVYCFYSSMTVRYALFNGQEIYFTYIYL